MATDSADDMGTRRVPGGEPADVISDLYRDHAVTDQEIAEVLGISRSAVAAYASRALAVLSRELRGDAWTM